MPIGLKIILSLVLLSLIPLFGLARPSAKAAHAGNSPRKGPRKDAGNPLRNLLMHSDGSPRRHAQSLGLITLYLLLALLWFGTPLAGH